MFSNGNFNHGVSGGGGGGGGGSGTVTNVAVISANGLSGNVANPTTTPAITLSTTVTGIVKGDGTTLSAAIAADFPTLNQNTTGNAATATNVQNGSANAIVYQTAASTTGFSKNTNGQAVLAQANGGAPFWQPYGEGLPFALAQYDNNNNLTANNLISSSTTYTTNNDTKSFNLTTPQIVQFIGTLNNTIVLPDATGGIGEAQTGLTYNIINNSNGSIIIKDAANTTLLTLVSGQNTIATLVTTGSTAGTWYLTQNSASSSLVLNPTVQTVSFTAALNTLYLIDSTSVVVVVSILATPAEGDQVGFISQNDTSIDEIQITNGVTELANINTNVKQYLVLTYINGGWVITTQTMVDNNGNLYTSALSNSATPSSTQVVPWSYINSKIPSKLISSATQTTSFTALPNHQYNVNSTSAAITATITTSNLSDGDMIVIKDIAGAAATNNITIVYNSINIAKLTINNQSIFLLYNLTANIWTNLSQQTINNLGILTLDSPQLLGLPVATNLTQQIDRYTNNGLPIVLTQNSGYVQSFTGTLAPESITLPATGGGLPDGFGYVIKNETTGTIPVLSATSTLLIDLPSNSVLNVQWDAPDLVWDISTSYSKENLITIGANYNLSTGDSYILIDATSNNITITLPLTSDNPLNTVKSWSFIRLDNSTNTVILQSQGSDTIFNGTTSNTLIIEGAKNAGVNLFTNFESTIFYQN